MASSQLTRWDLLKIIALLAMFVDHSGHFYFVGEEWLRGIGRAAAPLFLFLAGFVPRYTFSRRILLLALALTAIDWAVKGGPNTLNILWTILAARAMLGWLEGRGKFALKLHEWFIGSIAMLASIVVLQYGSLGFLFALCGYIFKHRAHYAEKTPELFLWLVMLAYGITYALLSQFALLTIIVMTPSLLAMVLLMQWFAAHPLVPVAIPKAFKPLSRYTAEIYVLHLAVLIVLTGKHL